MALTAKKVYAILKRQISDMEAKLNSPVRYRGTVVTADLLPLNPDIGDMYNIESKSIYGEAGMNVAWNGVVWDTMGAPIDMSLYIKSSELADWAKQPQKPDYTAEEVGALPANTKIPSKTSDLQNDSGFLTKIPDNYLSGTDKTLNVSGKAADAKATGDKITELSADISNKLNKNQGSENSGKIAGINESGDIVPMFPVSVDYNEETNCLEFGSDQKMELNKGINLDNTLTKTGYAADAGAVGKITNSLKEDIANKEDSKNLYRGTNFVQSEVELEKATIYYCHSKLSDNVKKTSGDSSYDSVKVEVKSGYVYRVSTYVKPDNNMFCLAVLVDEDGTMTAYKRNNTGSAISYIDEPIDVGSAKYIIVTSYTSKIAPTIKEAKLEFIYDYAESLSKKIDDANIEELPTFEKDIDSFNPIKETIEITIGEAWGSNGEPRTASAWKRTNKIAVIPNATYKVYEFIGEVCMYDSTGANGKFTQLQTAQNVEKVITIPSDRYYIAFDSAADSISNMSVYRTTPNESELNGVPMHSDELSVTLDNFKRISEVNIFCPLRGKTIVNMGDSIFGIFNPPFDISTYLSEYTGAITYNCGFGGSSMATHYQEDTYAKFSFWKLVDAIVSGDFTEQENALKLSSWTPPTSYALRLETLKNIDFNSVDVLTIAHGTNDFSYGFNIGNLENTEDVQTYLGALRYSLRKLMTEFSKIRVFVCTPIFRTWIDSDGSPIHYSDDVTQGELADNSSSLTYADYMTGLKNVADEYNIGYIDNYHIGMNRYNRLNYFEVLDGAHPKIEGRKLIARHMAKVLW